jgi:hypothetical protein
MSALDARLYDGCRAAAPGTGCAQRSSAAGGRKQRMIHSARASRTGTTLPRSRAKRCRCAHRGGASRRLRDPSGPGLTLRPSHQRGQDRRRWARQCRLDEKPPAPAIVPPFAGARVLWRMAEGGAPRLVRIQPAAHIEGWPATNRRPALSAAPRRVSASEGAASPSSLWS